METALENSSPSSRNFPSYLNELFGNVDSIDDIGILKRRLKSVKFLLIDLDGEKNCLFEEFQREKEKLLSIENKLIETQILCETQVKKMRLMERELEDAKNDILRNSSQLDQIQAAKAELEVQLKEQEQETEYQISLAERTLIEMKISSDTDREKAEKASAAADDMEFHLINAKMRLAETQEKADNFFWIASRYHEIIQRLDPSQKIVFDKQSGRRDDASF